MNNKQYNLDDIIKNHNITLNLVHSSNNEQQESIYIKKITEHLAKSNCQIIEMDYFDFSNSKSYLEVLTELNNLSSDKPKIILVYNKTNTKAHLESDREINTRISLINDNLRSLFEKTKDNNFSMILSELSYYLLDMPMRSRSTQFDTEKLLTLIPNESSDLTDDKDRIVQRINNIQNKAKEEDKSSFTQKQI